MLKTKNLLASAAILTLLFSSGAHAAEAISQDSAKAFLESNVSAWLNDATVIDAIKAQNAAHDGLSEDDVIALDKKWRADDQDLISATTDNALSTFLKDKQDAGEGKFTEIFVMDNKGMNVGQSALTSDYWQGDEAKWQDSFGAGVDAIHISDVEFDESSQTYQVQISTTISDGGAPIGAVTFGVDAESIE